jgi:hypothetical protein
MRGARVTFGQRGTFANLGIPGTGLSYRTRIDGSTNRSTGAASWRSLEAWSRRFNTQQAVDASQKSIAASEATYSELLDSWKRFPDQLALEDFNAACFERPFTFNEPPPLSPDWDIVAKELHSRLSREFELRSRRKLIRSILVTMMVVGSSVAIWHGALLLAGTISIIGLSSLLYVERLLTRLVRRRSSTAFDQRWPVESGLIYQELLGRFQAYQDRFAKSEAAWNEFESARAEWARRLLAGDLDALDETITATIAEVPFPFETTCDVSLNASHKVYLNLDLPEIEDVVETTSKRVLRDGRIKEVKRRNVDINLDYSRLAAGLGLLAAAHAFGCSPVIDTVEVAAFTQRTKRPGLPPDDCYVYNFEMRRHHADPNQLMVCEPVSLIYSWGGQIDPDGTGRLKEIARPSWC